MYKRKISAEDKIYAVNLYLNGKESQHRIASMFDVSVASVQQWACHYKNPFRERSDNFCAGVSVLSKAQKFF